MDVKKYRTTTSIVTRNISEFDKQTGNIYETIAMLSKRSNQISSELKRELVKKIEDFSSTTDTMEKASRNTALPPAASHSPQLKFFGGSLRGDFFEKSPPLNK